MHTKNTQEKIYNLWKENYSQNKTAKALNVPRSTIKDYFKKFSFGVYSGQKQHELNAHQHKTIHDILKKFDSGCKYCYCYMLGVYLGDGYIHKVKKLKNGNTVYRLRIFLDSKYPDIINEVIYALGTIFPENIIRKNKSKNSNCVVVYVYSNNIQKLFPQHGKGKKHNRKIKLTSWQIDLLKDNSNTKAFIRGLIHSDGCCYISKLKLKDKLYCYKLYSFSNHSEDIHKIFSWACNLLGIKTTHRAASKTTNIYQKPSREKLDEFVSYKS